MTPTLKELDNNIIASTGYLGFAISVGQLKSGIWRAYILSERTPDNRNSNWATDIEVVRDGYGYIISGATKVTLIEELKREYPNWKWVNHTIHTEYQIRG